MKVKKHHQLKNNSATTLSGVRPLGTLFVFFFVSCFPAYAVSLQETTTPRTFADWCLNKNFENRLGFVLLGHAAMLALQY